MEAVRFVNRLGDVSIATKSRGVHKRAFVTLAMPKLSVSVSVQRGQR